MQVQIEAKAMLAAIQAMTLVADKSGSKPILAGFHLHANGNSAAVFTATNFEQTIAYTVPATVDAPGEIVVNAKRAYDANKGIKAGPVVIADDAAMHVRVGKVTLPGVEPGLFPACDPPAAEYDFTLAPAELGRAVELVTAFCCAQETRKNLMGAHLELIKGGMALFTATDGHRLCCASAQVDGVMGAAPDIIIPRGALVIMGKLLKSAKATGPVRVYGDSQSIAFAFGGVSCHTRLIEGKFPNVNPVIPQEFTHRLTVESAPFVAALKVIAAMSVDKIKPVKLTVAADALLLESEPGESGRACEEIPCQYDGPGLEIGFNASYLLEALKAMRVPVVTLTGNGNLSPMRFDSLDDPDFLAVVMPLRIEW